MEFWARTLQVMPVPSNEKHSAKFIKDHFVSGVGQYGVGLSHLRISTATVDSAATNMSDNIDREGLKTVLLK